MKNIPKKIKPKHFFFSKGKEILYESTKQIAFLRCMQNTFLSAPEIEACRRWFRKRLKHKKKIKFFVRAYANLILTKKSKESRMGKGRGTKFNKQLCPIYPGKIIFEFRNIHPIYIRNLLRLIQPRLSTKLKLIISKKTIYYGKYRNTFKMS